MAKGISILGSTGSIGRQTLDVAATLNLPVAALAAGHNVQALEDQVRRFRPQLAVLFAEAAAKDLQARIRDLDTQVLWGQEGLTAAATLDAADTVVTSVVGNVGLLPTLEAIRAKKRIALANKETLVCAGKLVMDLARETGAEIIPVDSEHSAIFQCLMASGQGKTLRRLLITASGGPFRGKQFAELETVTPQQALRHPNWSMGAKITIDSATMMNKGLEFIEAMHLFGAAPDQIQVLVHPQSIIHSMVEFCDHSVMAQLGLPDMRLPIELALTYPRRGPGVVPELDLAAVGSLTFEEPDLKAFPCLALAMACARRGGTACAVLNAANEVAVARFLNGEMGFNDIYRCVQSAVDQVQHVADPSLQDILDADGQAREIARKVI